jgi:hypothetical protein
VLLLSLLFLVSVFLVPRFTYPLISACFLFLFLFIYIFCVCSIYIYIYPCTTFFSLFLLFLLWKIVFHFTLYRPSRLFPFIRIGRVEICKDVCVCVCIYIYIYVYKESRLADVNTSANRASCQHTPFHDFGGRSALEPPPSLRVACRGLVTDDVCQVSSHPSHYRPCWSSTREVPSISDLDIVHSTRAACWAKQFAMLITTTIKSIVHDNQI